MPELPPLTPVSAVVALSRMYVAGRKSPRFYYNPAGPLPRFASPFFCFYKLSHHSPQSSPATSAVVSPVEPPSTVNRPPLRA